MLPTSCLVPYSRQRTLLAAQISEAKTQVRERKTRLATLAVRVDSLREQETAVRGYLDKAFYHLDTLTTLDRLLTFRQAQGSLNVLYATCMNMGGPMSVQLPRLASLPATPTFSPAHDEAINCALITYYQTALFTGCIASTRSYSIPTLTSNPTMNRYLDTARDLDAAFTVFEEWVARPQLPRALAAGAIAGGIALLGSSFFMGTAMAICLSVAAGLAATHLFYTSFLRFRKEDVSRYVDNLVLVDQTLGSFEDVVDDVEYRLRHLRRTVDVPAATMLKEVCSGLKRLITQNDTELANPQSKEIVAFLDSQMGYYEKISGNRP